MFCKQCGHTIGDNEVKCSACGAKFGKGNRFCIFCGAKKENGASTCPNCGHSYTEFVKRNDQTKPEPVVSKKEPVLQPESPAPEVTENPTTIPEPIPDFGGNTSLQKIFANVNAQGMEEDRLLRQLSRQQSKPQQPQRKSGQPQTVKKPAPVGSPEISKAKPKEIQKSIQEKKEAAPVQQPKTNERAVKQEKAPDPITVVSDTPKSVQPVVSTNQPKSLKPDLAPHQTDPAPASVAVQKPVVATVEAVSPSGVTQTAPPPNTQPVQNETVSTPGFWQEVGDPPMPEKQPIAAPATNMGAVANMRQAHKDAVKNKQQTIPDALALVGAMLALATAMMTGDRCLFLGIAAFVASLIGISSKKLRFVALAGIIVTIVALVVAWSTKNISFIATFGPVN